MKASKSRKNRKTNNFKGKLVKNYGSIIAKQFGRT
jgi:hypothetical protein